MTNWTRPPACQCCGRSLRKDGIQLELNVCNHCGRWLCLSCYLKEDASVPYEQRDNSGSLFRNDKRESDSHPNMKGSAMIGGVEYWVSAWTNTSERTGEKYQKLSFQRKDDKPAAAPASKPARDNWDQEIPF